MAWFSVGDEAAPPVLILHGGPGGRSRVPSLNWFDGLGVRCIAHDQRGCGASVPSGECAHNTLERLVADIETLREHLGIDRWAVAGGSWGALLAVAYAAQHPGRVDGLFLRSAFLGGAAEVAAFFAPWSRWLGAEGAARLGWPLDDAGRGAAPVPDPVQLLQSVMPSADAGHLGDRRKAARIGEAWQAFEAAQAAPGGLAARPAARWLAGAPAERGAASPGPAAPTVPSLSAGLRIQQHYLSHGCFVDDALRAGWLDRLDAALAERPVMLVHGEADAVCAIEVGRGLAARWPWARCRWVPGAGHDMDQPVLRANLTAAAAEWTAALAALRP